MFGRNNKLDTGWLGSQAFFDGFNQSELGWVSALGEKVEVDAGTEIIDQGRVGDSCYVIVEGRAAVYIRGEFVTSVGPGSMVGEMALVEHRPRNASVVAETDMVLVSFGTAEFRKLLGESPNANEKVMTMLNARLRENQARTD
ncbi:MAG: cyclic nucleotide-binding domain-containing protein [Acidimicrobiales bacterium]